MKDFEQKIRKCCVCEKVIAISSPGKPIHSCLRYCPECKKAKTKAYYEKVVIIKCQKCNQDFEIKRRGSKKRKFCRECGLKKWSETMKRTMDSMTEEERKSNAKHGRSCVSKDAMSNAVKKQWQQFRDDPEKYKEICEAKSKRMEVCWTKFDDEKKNKIVSALVGSAGKARSKTCDLLKEEMIKAGIYNGFQSEQLFHGFIPDEINHELKIIVEFYGDFWHCNPKKYKDPQLYITQLGRTVGEQWKRDRKRLSCFYRNGYSVIIVWDRDFTRHTQKYIERIKNEIDKKRKTLAEI